MNKTLTVPLFMFAMTASASNMDSAAKEGYDLAEQTQTLAESTLRIFSHKKNCPILPPTPMRRIFINMQRKQAMPPISP
ncbi:hypothetical protein CBG25_06060 [Arsenophonus sp. ENCA]|nr:hypothetical protein CBG25_06060 [Arsenophonus sp. ENCA]